MTLLKFAFIVTPERLRWDRTLTLLFNNKTKPPEGDISLSVNRVEGENSW